MEYTHLFGPVCSRRLGRSLGIDLVPFKTCTFDCIYCECGATTHKTIQREEFFPVSEPEVELIRFLSGEPDLDFITFSGSGEPTLSLSIGEIIRLLKRDYPAYRVAVLTNGSLLHMPDVRADLLPADVVLPTLSSTFPKTFNRIHRPADGLIPAQIIEGLSRFRQEFDGEIWLEVFIIPGLNTTPDELDGLRDAIGRIRPDRIQLNTLDRPGTEEWVRPADTDELGRIAKVLGLPGTETIESVRYAPGASIPTGDMGAYILAMLKRRPCTLEDITAVTGLRRTEISKYLRQFEEMGILDTKKEDRGVFYRVRDQPVDTSE
ncbi:MAG: radical SAM protein [Methanoregulaceae archaeon]